MIADVRHRAARMASARSVYLHFFSFILARIGQSTIKNFRGFGITTVGRDGEEQMEYNPANSVNLWAAGAMRVRRCFLFFRCRFAFAVCQKILGAKRKEANRQRRGRVSRIEEGKKSFSSCNFFYESVNSIIFSVAELSFVISPCIFTVCNERRLLNRIDVILWYFFSIFTSQIPIWCERFAFILCMRTISGALPIPVPVPVPAVIQLDCR